MAKIFDNSAAVSDLVGPYNKCLTCDFIATQIKYCPFCGPELEHVPPQRRCPSCTVAVYHKDAKFCGTCGAAL